MVIPCYNEEASLAKLYAEITRVSQLLLDEHGLSCRFLLVNDGSRDSTLAIIKALRERDPRLDYLSFSRNFGKEAAIYAGLQHSQGDFVAVLDADLQHPPVMLLEMFAAIANEGYDYVAARRTSRRGEAPLRSFFARSFYRLMNSVSPTKLVDGATDFALFTRQVALAILALPEYNRFAKGLYAWVGYKTKWLPYENVERVAGSSKWSFVGLFHYSLQGILGYTTAPLALPLYLGGGLLLVALGALLYLLGVGPSAAGERPFLIVLICGCSGMVCLSLGIVALYLGKMYWEIKGRPVYIIQEMSME